MLLISRHLTEYDLTWPDDSVIRINLAWENDKELLEKHLTQLRYDVFLDMPVGRKKPPNISWDLDEVGEIVESFNCVKYVAFSNVENEDVIYKYNYLLNERVCIVPKIESVEGCKNAHEIIAALRNNTRKTIMIDHDDLFLDVVKNDFRPSSLYSEFILPLVKYCKSMNVQVLRTAGIIFSDQ